jgi:hypothetical protein
MMTWYAKHPQVTMDMLGFIPSFLNEEDKRPAKEQIDSNYSHGGGWSAFHGFTMLPNGNLSYPGDPEVLLLAETKLRDETIRFYEHSWLCIIQPDGSFEIARVD